MCIGMESATLSRNAQGMWTNAFIEAVLMYATQDFFELRHPIIFLAVLHCFKQDLR